MIEKTDDRMEALAKEVAENMDLDNLISFAQDRILAEYEKNNDMFQEDWELYMEGEEEEVEYRDRFRKPKPVTRFHPGTPRHVQEEVLRERHESKCDECGDIFPHTGDDLCYECLKALGA